MLLAWTCFFYSIHFFSVFNVIFHTNHVECLFAAQILNGILENIKIEGKLCVFNCLKCRNDCVVCSHLHNITKTTTTATENQPKRVSEIPCHRFHSINKSKFHISSFVYLAKFRLFVCLFLLLDCFYSSFSLLLRFVLLFKSFTVSFVVLNVLFCLSKRSIASVKVFWKQNNWIVSSGWHLAAQFVSNVYWK